MARAIRIHSDRLAFFRSEIHNITREQCIIAWEWILYGDWTFKGANPTLELADFFPTDKQVEDVKSRLRDRGLRVIVAADLDREMKINYNAGYADGYAEASKHRREAAEVKQALQTKMEEIS